MTNTTVSAELPEALRLADAIDPFVRKERPDHLTSKVAADELRRLHAQVEALSAAQAGVPSDAMVEAYLQAQRRACEEADRYWGGPSIGALHTNTVRDACRAGLKAALAAAPQPSPSPAPAQPGQEGERDYPPLPEPDLGMPWRVNAKSDGAAHSSGFTYTQMRAYVDADRAARAAPQPATADAVDARITAIEQAIRDYHYALDTRQHGGVAQDRAFNAISNAMGMHWTQGEESARRALSAQPGGTS